MKILMVAIPNHHFFQWVNQLERSGYEVYWFDITDGGPEVERINWVNQIKGWKLKYDYPFRHKIKKTFPFLYKFIQKYNEHKIENVFQKQLNLIKPDIVHCFEMKLSGLPILSIMKKHENIKFIYSSWGSDMYFYNKLGVQKKQVQDFFDNINYLITDCKRDYQIALENGFKTKYLGVFPGNGGILINKNQIQNLEERNILLIKGYDDGVGKAVKVLDAMELLPNSVFKNLEIIVYSADKSVIKKIEKSPFFANLKVKIFNRNEFLDNQKLLEIMGKSMIHIGNSVSDGMPNSLLEAMGMGAFPIQSNPGNVTREIINHGKNGFLITDPLDIYAISDLIVNAIKNYELREKAMQYNIDFINKNYNRNVLENEIINLYKDIYKN